MAARPSRECLDMAERMRNIWILSSMLSVLRAAVREGERERGRERGREGGKEGEREGGIPHTYVL